MRTLHCEGLTLEPQAAEHAPEMFALLADPAIYEYENTPPESLQWLTERFTRLEARVSPDGQEQWLNWVIRTPAGMAGFVQATIYPGGRADIAYVLASAHWGRGVASAAVKLMIAELRDQYGVGTLWATFRNENIRSRRLLERLGFSKVSAKELAARKLEVEEGMMKRELAPKTPVAINALEAPPRAKASIYPEPFASMMKARLKRPLGDVFGLANFGVNLTRIAPGGCSALRHAHSKQDEFIYVLEGRPTLRTDEGDAKLAPGMCAGFRAGTGNAHQLLNETDADVLYLEVGDRTPGDTATYPDDDLAAVAVAGGWKFTRKDGSEY